MKTIQAGKLPTEMWPYTVRFTCSKCGGVFMLDENDSVKIQEDQQEGTWVTVNCPTQGCGNRLTSNKPQPPNYNNYWEDR